MSSWNLNAPIKGLRTKEEELQLKKFRNKFIEFLEKEAAKDKIGIPETLFRASLVVSQVWIAAAVKGKEHLIKAIFSEGFDLALNNKSLLEESNVEGEEDERE